VLLYLTDKNAFFRALLWRLLLPVMKFAILIAQPNFIARTLKTIKADGAVMEIGLGDAVI
jgi:hypothetical protein